MARETYYIDFAVEQEIEARQGDTFDLHAKLSTVDPSTSNDVPIDMTGYEINAQFRDSEGNVAFEILDSNWQKNYDGETGAVLGLVDDVTMSSVAPGSYNYDIQLREISTGIKKTWVYGICIINAQSTTV